MDHIGTPRSDANPQGGVTLAAIMDPGGCCARMNARFPTEVDPEIAVSGSIDPLSLLALWERDGR
jgi:hypothetical protein